jgi:signal transduction histidine kinase/CheY-like chemotaxis protein
MEERSPAFTLLGITMTEIAINLVFPLITLYITAVDKRFRSVFNKIFIIQTIFAVVILFLIPFNNYWGTAFVEGRIKLLLNKNLVFYFTLVFNVLSPLVNIVMINYVYNRAKYKRDKVQKVLWKTNLFIALVPLIIRFYFPFTYKYGCIIQVFLLILVYFHCQRYNTAALTLFNVVSDVYSLVRIPLLVLDDADRVVLTNNSALLFFKKDPGELAGMSIGELFDFGNYPPVFSKARRTKNQTDMFEAVSRHNGAWCEIEATRIYDQFREFLHAILFIYDMTNIKRLIKELEEEKHRAELANQAKSAFLANTSHEIRTPMNAIIGMSELILRENISPEVYEYTLNIRQAGANLLSLINDILDFSKIESGKLEINPIRYQFHSVLNDVINIIRMRVSEKSLAFIVDIDASMPDDLEGDEARVRQILLNLLGNAVKYTERGFIRLAVSVERMGDGEGTAGLILNMAVEDSGTGIKPEDLDKIFGEFVQVNAAAHQGIEGSGLGLTITKGLCRAMGGDISVTSTYGTGSVFRVRFPQQETGKTPFAALEEGEKKPILVYENRPLYAASIRRSLENLGAPHTLVETAEAFQEALRRDRPPAQSGSPGEYRFALIAYSLYEPVRAVLETRKGTIQVILLADYGFEPETPSIYFLTLPVHVLSLANILNHREGPRHTAEKEAVAFTAPSVRILVVDDILTNLKVARGLMIPYGMAIDTCQSGPQAIELLRENKYDLIVMDHMMPEMDGIEAVRLIRLMEDRENYFKRVPVIALTANALSGMKEMFLDRGFNDYIPKPIETSKLNGVLEQWIPREKQIKTGSSVPPETVPEKRAAPAALVPPEGSGTVIPLEDQAIPNHIMETIDFAAALKQYKDQETYREVLRSYRAVVPGLLDTLRGLTRDHPEVYAAAVHDLKGLSYRIYADRAGRQAETLEHAAKAGNWETLQGGNHGLIRAVETLLGDIEKLLI